MGTRWNLETWCENFKFAKSVNSVDQDLVTVFRAPSYESYSFPPLSAIPLARSGPKQVPDSFIPRLLPVTIDIDPLAPREGGGEGDAATGVAGDLWSAGGPALNMQGADTVLPVSRCEEAGGTRT